MTKVFVLFNEKANGYLDQNQWGYILNSYNHGEIDLEKSKVENVYIRWIFIERNNFFLIQNPKTGKYLSSYKGSHTMEGSLVNEGFKSEYADWDLQYFVEKDKKYVILKSVKTNEFFTAEGFNQYSPGQSNTYGYHMTSYTQGDPRLNPFLRFEMSELPLEVLHNFNESENNHYHEVNDDDYEED